MSEALEVCHETYDEKSRERELVGGTNCVILLKGDVLYIGFQVRALLF